MATGVIPASNPAGNNQTSPTMMPSMNPIQSLPGAAGSVPTATPTAQASSNPYVPASSIIPQGTNPQQAGGLVQSTANVSGTSGALNKQLTDIFGKGVGGAESNLINSIGGVDSATLQEYIASLAPQEATAQSNLNASLGAGGVSANSSVAALGDANLKAQETAAIAGESANLTQSGQNLEASLLTGMQNPAAQQVNESGWNILGSVLQGGASAASSVISALGSAGVKL